MVFREYLMCTKLLTSGGVRTRILEFGNFTPFRVGKKPSKMKKDALFIVNCNIAISRYLNFRNKEFKSKRKLIGTLNMKNQQEIRSVIFGQKASHFLNRFILK